MVRDPKRRGGHENGEWEMLGREKLIGGRQKKNMKKYKQYQHFSNFER